MTISSSQKWRSLFWNLGPKLFIPGNLLLDVRFLEKLSPASTLLLWKNHVRFSASALQIVTASYYGSIYFLN